MLKKIVCGFLPGWGAGVREKGEHPSAVCMYLIVDGVGGERVEDRANLNCSEYREEFAEEGGRSLDRVIAGDADGDGGGV